MDNDTILVVLDIADIIIWIKLVFYHGNIKKHYKYVCLMKIKDVIDTDALF